MKNGFVIPVIVWIIVGAFAVLAISKPGSFNNPISTLQPPPTPTSSVTSTPIPIPTTYGPINTIAEPTHTSIISPSPVPTDSPVTHDGSKTGKIIDYFEMSSGKQIKVYENELLPFTDIRGKFGYYTQKDIDWDKKTFGDPNDPVETCHSSICGDKQLKRSQCNTDYVCCGLQYASGWLSKESCSNIQNKYAPKPPTEQQIAEEKAKWLSNYNYCVKVVEKAKNDPVRQGDVYWPNSEGDISQCNPFLRGECVWVGGGCSLDGCPPLLGDICYDTPK